MDIFEAIEKNDIEAMKLFIKYGAKELDNHGNTVLMRAVSLRNPNIEIIKLLLENGAEVKAVNNFGTTAFMKALYSSTPNVELIKLLLEYGAETNAKELMVAVEYFNPNLEIVKLFVEYEIEVNAADENGSTILMSCVKDYSPKMEIIEFLLKNGANINAKDNNGLTALMYAVSNFNLNIKLIKLLLENGADTNAVDKNSNTVLTKAISFSEPNLEVIKLLIEHNADTNDLEFLKFLLKDSKMLDLFINKGMTIHNSPEGQKVIQQQIYLSKENLHFTKADFLAQYLKDSANKNLLDSTNYILQDDLNKSGEIYKYQAAIHLLENAEINISSRIAQYINNSKKYFDINTDFELVYQYLPELSKYYLKLAEDHLLNNLKFKDVQSKFDAKEIISKLFDSENNQYLEEFIKLNNLLINPIRTIDTEYGAQYFVQNSVLKLISDDHIQEVNFLNGLNPQFLDESQTLFRGAHGNLNEEQINNIFIYGYKIYNAEEYNVFGYHAKYECLPYAKSYRKFDTYYVDLYKENLEKFANHELYRVTNNLIIEINLPKGTPFTHGKNYFLYEPAINIIEGKNIKAIYKLNSIAQTIQTFNNPYYNYSENLIFEKSKSLKAVLSRYNLLYPKGIDDEYPDSHCEFYSFKKNTVFLETPTPDSVEDLRAEAYGECSAYASLKIQGQCEIVKGFADYMNQDICAA